MAAVVVVEGEVEVGDVERVGEVEVDSVKDEESDGGGVSS